MGLAATIARRSLLERPGRTLFSVLGIAVGIATVVGIFTLDHNTVIGRSQSDDPDWQAEIEVSPSLAVENPRAELEDVPGVLEIAAAFQNEVMVRRADGAGRDRRARLVGLEAKNARSLGAYSLLSGRGLDPAGPRRQALVGEALAERLELVPGSEIRLARPAKRPARECVGGEWVTRGEGESAPPVFETFQVTGVLDRVGLGRRSRGEVVVVDYRDGLELYDGRKVQTRFWLKHDPNVNLERLQSSLGEAWSYDLKKSVIIGQAADERAFRNGVRFAGLLALVLGLFVIFHTLSMSLVERVREVGILHALGASRAQIGRVFLAEATIISFLGGAAGLAGGLLMAKALLKVGITTVGVGRHINVFFVPWGLVAPLVAAGVVIALVGSVYPLARARNTSAVSALRGEEAAGAKGVARGFQILAALLLAGVLPALYFGIVPVIGETQKELVGVLMLGLAIVALFVIVPLVVPAFLAWVCARLAQPFELAWPLAGKLASRAISRGPARVAGAVAALALVTAGFVGLRGMTRSLEGEIDVWSREAFRDKVFVRNLPPTPFDQLSGLLRTYVPETIAIEPNEARTYVPFLLVGLKEDELAAFGPASRDDTIVRRMRDEHAVILSRRLARHRGYEIGDEVHVSAANGDVVSLPVIGINDSYGYFPHPDERLYGVISDRWMQEYFCIDTDVTSQASVVLPPGSDLDEAALAMETGLKELYPDAPITVETGEYLYAWHSSDIARDFILFDIIIALTMALAGLGVLNGQLLSALERAKELGVLKALGMSRRQVAGTVLLESAVVGLLGGGLGVLLGTALTPFIVEALQVISGLPLPHRSAGAWIVAGWVGAVVVALLAGLYPIWRMNRADAIAAVRTG